MDLLGHQSWAGKTFGLLKAHPEFDETPGLYKDNAGIYCRSYCPLHPQVHAVLFDVIDEIMDAFEAKALHAGMDEVFLIGEDTCVRCKGKDKAQLFAGEVRAIHDHLAEKGRRLWIWSDRLIDGKTTGIGEWEASQNGTAAALREIPRDVVLCDWHYESAHPTALAFALDGFEVLSSPWRQTGVGLRQLDLIRLGREEASPEVAARLRGVLLPVTEAHVQYEGKAGYDDRLKMTTTATWGGRARLQFDVLIQQADGGAAVCPSEMA